MAVERQTMIIFVARRFFGLTTRGSLSKDDDRARLTFASRGAFSTYESVAARKRVTSSRP